MNLAKRSVHIRMCAREVGAVGFTRVFTDILDDDQARVAGMGYGSALELPFPAAVKTGTTNASGRCLVSTGTLNGRSVVVVVLKSNSANIWSDSSKLLRWALERPGSDA